MYHSIIETSPYQVFLAPCEDSEVEPFGTVGDAGAWPCGILFASGPDAVGLVATAAGWLKDRGANIEASYASRLMTTHGAQYRFRIDRHGWDTLPDELPEAAAALARCRERADAVRPSESVRYELNSLAPRDEPGILADVAGIFGATGINIVTHASRRFSAVRPDADPRLPSAGHGDEMFTINMKVDIPRARAARALPEVLSRIAALEKARGWDITFGERCRAARGRSRTRGELATLLN